MRRPAALFSLALLVSGTARAQPTVLIRAESRIELRIEHGDRHVRVRGVLRDDLGGALGDRTLRLRVTPEGSAAAVLARDVHTDRDGNFAAEVAVQGASYRLYATFDGDRLHERVEVARALDLNRAEVRLRVSVPERGQLDLDRLEHEFVVRVESDAGGGGVDVNLLDELDRQLQETRTDASGTARFVVRSVDLGAPGAGRVKARSHADGLRAEAQTEVPVVRFRATSLTLGASRDRVEPREAFRLAGRLTDSQGPLPGRAVGLFDGEMHLGTVLTDTDGAFLADVALEREDDGVVDIVARFDSDAPGRASSTSPPVTVHVEAAGRASLGWLLVPVLLSGLVLFLIARRTPRPDAGTRAREDAVPAGVRAAPRATRRAERTDVAGRVVDRHRDDPVPHAIVELACGDATIRATVGADGRFHAASVAPGRWRLRAEAPGYVAEVAELEVPHRGEWSALEVRLDSLRDRAVEPYRAVALEVLPSSRLWAVLTNREFLARARDEVPDPAAIEDLTARVEVASYGAEPPTASEVSEIDERAARAIDAIRSTR